MACVTDAASEIEELHLSVAIANKRPEGPAPVGYCLTCGEDEGMESRRWCSPRCARDWERKESRRVG